MKARFVKDSLYQLNIVQVHQQVMFLSCALGASGKTLDNKYLSKRKPGEACGSMVKLKFPKEQPPKKYLNLWEMALRQVVPAGESIQDCLGRLLHLGCKVWD